MSLVTPNAKTTNHPDDSLSEYFRRSLYAPYLDSLLSSLEARFIIFIYLKGLAKFNLSLLHPAQMAKITAPDLKIHMEEVSKFYELEGIETEADLWQCFWTNKKENLETLELTDVIQHAETFYLNVNTALHILLAMPYSTATIKRTLSTLRRVKTWLRSTMSEETLNGLCMLCVHRKLVNSLSDSFTELVLSRFSENPKKFLFK